MPRGWASKLTDKVAMALALRAFRVQPSALKGQRFRVQGYVCMCGRTYLYVYVYIYIYISTHTSICLSICMSIYYLSIYLPIVVVFVYQVLCLFVLLCTCLCTCICICTRFMYIRSSGQGFCSGSRLLGFELPYTPNPHPHTFQNFGPGSQKC